MNIILVSMGTAGDVYPFIGLGIALRARGHQVTLVANSRYQRFAVEHDFEFASLVSESDTRSLLSDPDIWHPVKSAYVGARWARSRLAQQYETLKSVVTTRADVLVAYPPVMAARLVQQSLGTRLVSLVPMPWMIPSVIRPPRMAGILNLPNMTPRPLRSAYWWALNVLTDYLVGRDVNRLRQSLALPPVRSVARWMFSPQLTIALFPAWYASVQSDWPHNTHAVGFSDFDGATETALPDELQDFCRAGEPPVAFTFGSGMHHAGPLFRKAAKICVERRWRAIFISPDDQQVPGRLPDTIAHCTYAPFHQLLPRCAALVHHGGLGTTAQALAAGVPQLITPFAWDQYDNAARVKRLRAGNWCKPTRSGRHWRTLLSSLRTADQRAHCRQVADRLRNQDANTRAAELLEELSAVGSEG